MGSPPGVSYRHLNGVETFIKWQAELEGSIFSSSNWVSVDDCPCARLSFAGTSYNAHFGNGIVRRSK
ncbi:MAG: hypothetical protein VCB79_00080 [Dehalococcoidia bacterium]